LVDAAEPGAGPPFTHATDITMSQSPRAVWIVDEALESLLLVDLISGQRVIASGHTSQ
jgi:hypothetical protein